MVIVIIIINDGDELLNVVEWCKVYGDKGIRFSMSEWVEWMIWKLVNMKC